jgi:hypothetical protein
METAAGDEVLTPPRGFQAPLPLGAIDVFQTVPLGSTAKISVSPVVNEVLAAGPVPVIVLPTRFVAWGAVVPLAWPLALAGLLTAAKSETSIRTAKATPIAIRLRFIFSPTTGKQS